MVFHEWRFHYIHEYLSNILSESMLYEFLNLSTGGQGPPFSLAFHFGMTASNELKKEPAFCQEVSAQEVTY